MSELILVLEENPEIQAVIAASLKDSSILITQESNPDFYLQQAQTLSPDLIFLSNSDSDSDYNTCREIRKDSALKNIPLILLVNAKDEIKEEVLNELQINGMLRKPFEASMLKEQISKYISLDENFGTEPDNGYENLAVDMSTIDNQLKDINQDIQGQTDIDPEASNVIGDLVQSSQESLSATSKASEMDSLVLENILTDPDNQEKIFSEKDLLPDESEKNSDGLEVIDDVEMEMDNGFNFDLTLEEEEIEDESIEEEAETAATDIEVSPGGLEQLKLSGLEDKFAESRFNNDEEEQEQTLRSGLTDINLEKNDFEDPNVIWTHPPDLDQTPREGLKDISLDQTDFHPDFPKHLSSFETPSAPLMDDDKAVSEDLSEPSQQLEDYEQGSLNEDTNSVQGSTLDDILLTDSEVQDITDSEEIEDAEQFIIDTSVEEFEEGLIENRGDDEIHSMVRESIEDEGITIETALGELEDLSEQMESLESEEEELDAEEEEFEKELEIEDFETEIIPVESTTVTAVYQEDELAEFMVDELGDLLEPDEEEVEGVSIAAADELEIITKEELGDFDEDDAELESFQTSEISTALDEEVFDSWDEAEEAFMGFDKDEDTAEEETDWTETETEQSESTVREDLSEKGDKFSFNEDELKDIVTSSVQNAPSVIWLIRSSKKGVTSFPSIFLSLTSFIDMEIACSMSASSMASSVDTGLAITSPPANPNSHFTFMQ